MIGDVTSRPIAATAPSFDGTLITSEALVLGETTTIAPTAQEELVRTYLAAE